jgi:hypothetical protein
MSLSRSVTWVVAPQKHLAFLSFQSSQVTSAKIELAPWWHCPVYCSLQTFQWSRVELDVLVGVFLATLIECTTRLTWSRSNPRWYGQWTPVLGRIGNNCPVFVGHVASAGLLSNDAAWGQAKGIVVHWAKARQGSIKETKLFFFSKICLPPSPGLATGKEHRYASLEFTCYILSKNSRIGERENAILKSCFGRRFHSTRKHPARFCGSYWFEIKFNYTYNS